MIVPQYWAEASRKGKVKRRSFTVRHFGWSDTNQEDAQMNADARADDALGRLMAGDKLVRLGDRVSACR